MYDIRDICDMNNMCDMCDICDMHIILYIHFCLSKLVLDAVGYLLAMLKAWYEAHSCYSASHRLCIHYVHSAKKTLSTSL